VYSVCAVIKESHMDMVRFDLANTFYEEYSEIMMSYLLPLDLSATQDEPGFDSRNYTALPEEAADSHCEGIYINGGNSIKKRWLSVLPSVSGVKRAVLYTTAISETLMQAVCSHTGIERLRFEGTRLESFEVLAQLPRLTHLAIGSSPRVTSLSPLTKLPNVIALSIQGNFPNIDDLDELSSLTSLRGIGLCGLDYKVLKLHNLSVLSELVALRFISLIGVRISNDGLRALCDLPELEFLSLDPFHMNIWKRSDIAAINEAHPNLKGSLIRRVATEPEIARVLKVG